MCAVDVADEEGLDGSVRVRLEGLDGHDGPEVRASDTDVDDGGDLLAGVSLPFAGPDLVGELLYVLEDVSDLVSAGFVDLEGAIGVPEGDVQDGTALGSVDVLPGEHLIPGLLDIGLPGEIEEGVEDLVVDEIL